MLKKLSDFLSLVRFSHTLFALPFALAAMFWAARGWPGFKVFGLVLLCMVFCRNAAMAFNRLVDARIDAKNPRTARRHLPARVLGRGEVLVFFLANAVLFVAAAALLNPLALALAVPALAAVCFYSLTKRFTHASHLFLGLAIGISPVGAWIAVQGAFSPEPLFLAAALMLWIAGFDIIYATQDEAFDRAHGLHSAVVRYGKSGALRLSAALHALMVLVLAGIELLFGLGWPYRVSLCIAAGLILYLHLFRRSDALDSLNQDFFLANIAISVVIFLGLTIAVF
jgi:4-hydroxybenzoate polyprenyltransferase